MSALPAIIRDRFGLYVPAADLHLDARRAPGLTFVSHAHSDHCSSAPRIVCTKETAELHRRRRGVKEVVTLAFGEQLPLRNSTLQLTPAGHTLGSAMAIVRSEEGVLAYTGDYKLRPGPFSAGVTVPRCDTLVMECTFGQPRYRFPPETEVLERLFAFIDAALAAGDVPVVLAYAFGKTQDALYHLTMRGYHVGVHGPGAALCQAHVDLGYHFPGPGSWSTWPNATSRPQVLLMTPRGRDSLPGSSRRYRCVHLTGWACSRNPARFTGRDFALPFSGHADFAELERTAAESGARKIYTVHGAPGFAAYLRSRGYDARHLGSGGGAAAAVSPEPRDQAAAVSPRSRATQLSLELS
ncbi:MAG TPA: MBL fold metallo-hydrolase [Gemmatimonadaceae bacterium]